MLTQEYLKEILHYNPDTGIFTWIVDRGRRTSIGDIAGCYDNDGYRIIRFDGFGYKLHRLAFLYVNGNIPEQVDHINHCRDDNRWINLRSANKYINGMNKSIPLTNKSGFSGVRFNKKHGKYVSNIKVRGKAIYLGCFINIVDAVIARKMAEYEYGFHENHGL